jgi:hypothetical protein
MGGAKQSKSFLTRASFHSPEAQEGKCPAESPVADAEPPKPVHEVAFLENFFDELRRRVPVRK